MTQSLSLGSGCTGWGWRKSQVTSAGRAVPKTGVAQICHGGFSITVTDADRRIAPQRQGDQIGS